MGIPLTGAFVRANQAPVGYATALKWGTGINQVHAIRGGPGRPQGNVNPRELKDLEERTQAEEAVPDFIEYGAPWGEDRNDFAGLDVVANQSEAVQGVPFSQDDWPDWGEDTETLRDHIPSDASHPWTGHPGQGEQVRRINGGPQWLADTNSWQTPSETVSEGWKNKADDGKPADAKPADEAQVFIQTSMVQRYKSQNNDRATQRGGPHSDVARTPIDSRVRGEKVKVYSGRQRHYDMTPRRADPIPRPFRFRTAGTGPGWYGLPNEYVSPSPLMRTPPPDPAQGIQDTSLQDSYGYTEEDNQGWYI